MPKPPSNNRKARSKTAESFRGSRLDRYTRGVRMNFGFTIVETSLNRAEFRWKWLRFWQRSFALATFVCLALALLAGAILLGWLTSRIATLAILIVLGISAFITWMVLVIVVAASSPDRNWLAAALERVDNRLLDRLNTLLFLERHRTEAPAESFALRIAKQTQTVFAEKPPPPAFPATSPLNWLLAFLVVLTGTILLFELGLPWQRLLAGGGRKPIPLAEVEKNLELALPPTNNVEQNLAWGEVRITDPGADLKVTKVDVVPLQIEAAANAGARFLVSPGMTPRLLEAAVRSPALFTNPPYSPAGSTTS
jgi:hypothetical protein